MFDSLPETRGNGRLIASRSLSTAVLVHGLVIAAIVSAAFLARVDAGEDPPKPYELVRVIPLDIPQGTPVAGGGGRPEKAPTPAPPQKKEPEPAPIEPMQPVFVDTLPTPVPEPAAEPAAPAPSTIVPANEGEGGLGGSGEGGGKGKGKGRGFGDGEEDGTQGDPNGIEGPLGDIYVVTGPVEAPVLILKVQPEYPEIARAAHREGNVILQAVIGADGHVESVSVLRSEPLFDKSAIKAVSQWVYRPARLRGLPVKVFFTVYVEFRLN
jgi:protein TonB